jgi:hypothetical protein
VTGLASLDAVAVVRESSVAVEVETSELRALDDEHLPVDQRAGQSVPKHRREVVQEGPGKSWPRPWMSRRCPSPTRQAPGPLGEEKAGVRSAPSHGPRSWLRRSPAGSSPVRGIN